MLWQNCLVPPTSVSKVDANWCTVPCGHLSPSSRPCRRIPLRDFYSPWKSGPGSAGRAGTRITARGCLGKWAVVPGRSQEEPGLLPVGPLCSSTDCPPGTLGHHPSPSSQCRWWNWHFWFVWDCGSLKRVLVSVCGTSCIVALVSLGPRAGWCPRQGRARWLIPWLTGSSACLLPQARASPGAQLPAARPRGP